MANATYKKRSITYFTHHPLFQQGLKDKRLGRKISVAMSMIDATHGNDEALIYEYGRLFAAMNPHVAARELARKEREIEQHVVAAWNDFVRVNNFGTTK